MLAGLSNLKIVLVIGVAQFCCAVLALSGVGRSEMLQWDEFQSGWLKGSFSDLKVSLKISICKFENRCSKVAVNTMFKSKILKLLNWFLPLSIQGLCLISLALNVNFLFHLPWLPTSIKFCLLPALFVCVCVCVLMNKPQPEKHHQKCSHVQPWMKETL